MSKFKFTKATKKGKHLRLALLGPAGAGKTFSSLAIGAGLGERIALIDTEHGSASKYADKFSFETLELESFEPGTYVEAIQAAEAEGFDVIIVDSLSHAWMGKGGALEQVDRAKKRGGGNGFNAWGDVTPQHNALVEAMLACRAHLIVTMRTKMEYVQEKDERTGKTTVRKVGMAPVQRDGLEYEFDVVGELNADSELQISKTRCSELAGGYISKPGLKLAATLRAWLADADPAPAAAPPREDPAEQPPEGPNPEVGEPAAFYLRLNEIELPGESVAVWLKWRAEIGALPVEDREAAWKALCARTEVVGRMKNAKVWLKKAIAEEDARRGPTEGGARTARQPDAPSDDEPTPTPPAGGSGGGAGGGAPASAAGGGQTGRAQAPAPAAKLDPLAGYRARVAAATTLDMLVATCIELGGSLPQEHRQAAWNVATFRAAELGDPSLLAPAIEAAKKQSADPSHWRVVAQVLAGLATAATAAEVAAVVRQHGAAASRLPEALHARLNAARTVRLAALSSVAAGLEAELNAAHDIPSIEGLGDKIVAAFKAGQLTVEQVTALTNLQDALCAAMERAA